MENIVGQTYAFVHKLTDSQLTDLNAGMNACSAFWQAAIGHQSYGSEHLRPHTRCIYSALAVLDVLKCMGRTDAFVQKVGLDVRRFASDCNTLRQGLAVGTPGYVPSGKEKRWNAHLIVRLGDVFIDPSISQARRPWNDLPDFAAMINSAPENLEIEIGGEFAKAKAAWVSQTAGEYIQITYFDLLRAQDMATRGYLKAPDAKLEARSEIVDLAVKNLINHSNPHAWGTVTPSKNVA